MIVWKFVLRCVVSDMADGMCSVHTSSDFKWFVCLCVCVSLSFIACNPANECEKGTWTVMIDTQLQSNTAEHRVDFLELIQNSLHFLSFSLSFQTRIYQLLHIWFTGDSFGPALLGSRYKSRIILPGTLESVPSMWRPNCFHFSFRMEKKSSIGRKIGKNLEFVRDRFWCFDSSFLSHHVTAVTFRTTFYVWLTITVNNIVRKQDIKVNENVHKRIFCCCVEKCMQWITEIERDGMKNRLMEDKEECHWERDEEEIFMCKLRYTHTHKYTL